jgi:hypothetical protein
MISKQGHGTDVILDDLWSTLEPTRLLRLALNILSRRLPADVETESVRESLGSIHEWICKAELKALRTWGLPTQYVIIRPINPLNPPGPEDMEKISSAIRALDDLGLVVRPA